MTVRPSDPGTGEKRAHWENGPRIIGTAFRLARVSDLHDPPRRPDGLRRTQVPAKGNAFVANGKQDTSCRAICVIPSIVMYSRQPQYPSQMLC